MTRLTHTLVYTCMRSSAGASVLAVVPALVDLTSLSSVAGLTATLGHLTGVEEAAPTVLTLNIAGSWGGGCRRGIPQSTNTLFEGSKSKTTHMLNCLSWSRDTVVYYTATVSAWVGKCIADVETYRMVTGWGSVSPHMCHCRPCSC